ncbi:MAG: cryptochrome/photolyase family protein [Wenzhouxiangellaceae bacterium]|nr:cryptochrome/photolyase family protein [Wenzhouxiangellaceae bacterium]
MPKLCLVTGDQLSEGLVSLQELERGVDHVLLAELADEAGYVPHHRKKIALIFSAMRHFAARLERVGHCVYYRHFDAASPVRSFTDALRAHLDEHDIDQIVLTWPGEWRVLAEFRALEATLKRPVTILEDDRFVCPIGNFTDWAKGRRVLRMEYFYREMRRCTGLLMEGDQPVGGQWNFDAQNRRKWTGDPPPARPMAFSPDATTRAVLERVAETFDGFGELEGFDFAVTPGQARRALAHFVEHGLRWFGDFQDALPDGEDWLFHSRLSAYMNIGLLDPLEVCRAVEDAWREGQVPINAAEGYIRQVIGWREYIRGIYWLKMPDYSDENYFDNAEALPSFYWSGETGMRCVAQAVATTRRNAYAHHIQRLMVTGNFALLLGVAPKEICDWYLAVYADAFDWVELPNTLGMVMFADGGVLASKPYAASGKYIQRMGDHCANCRYKVGERTGADACPFNALYWDFLMRHEDRLAANPRMKMMYRNVARLKPAEKSAITRRANWIRANTEAL